MPNKGAAYEAERKGVRELLDTFVAKYPGWTLVGDMRTTQNYFRATVVDGTGKRIPLYYTQGAMVGGWTKS